MPDFSDLNLDPTVLEAIKSAGYSQPTPIQTQAIPPALEGRDVLGIAQTGTGKTASFVLPMITMLSKGRARARMPRSLVLAPTRELAAQVSESFSLYSRGSRLTMGLLIGGTSFNAQLDLINRGVDVLIATPGRLLDHFERGRLLLSDVKIMVVDEADRMLDMGFIPDIERIFKLTPFTRQTLFFSATMAREIERITNEFLSNPVRVEVTRRATVSENIAQSALMFQPSGKAAEFKEKRALLRRALEEAGDEVVNGIIFCNRKSDIDVLQRSMKAHGIDSAAIHGDLAQPVRMTVLDDFRNGKIRFMIASDVAARGLDIPNVSHVFNFDIPVNSEDYVHRIGRTGRAGRKGAALTILTRKQKGKLQEIEQLVEAEISLREVETPADGRKRKPAPDRPKSRSGESRRAAPAKAPAEKRGRKPPVRKAGKSANAPNAVGLGDHLPDFMRRSVAASTPESADK